MNNFTKGLLMGSAIALALYAPLAMAAEPPACEQVRDDLRTAYNEQAAVAGLPSWEDFAAAGFNNDARYVVASSFTQQYLSAANAGMSDFSNMTLSEMDEASEQWSGMFGDMMQSRNLINSMRALSCDWR